MTEGCHGALEAAQMDLHLPLGYKVGEISFRQKALLVTFLEEEVCTVTAVRENRMREVGTELGLLRNGNNGFLPCLLPPSG